MATRPTKTKGTQTYTTEVAAGGTVIKASEVDADLNEIYTNIINANIAPGAAIAYSKLTLAASIATGDLVDLNVTTGKLAINASVPNKTQIAASGVSISTTTETTLATLGSITTRGGRVLVVCNIAASLSIATGSGTQLLVRLYQDGVVAQIVGATDAVWGFNLNASGGATVEAPFPIAWTAILAPTAAAHVYAVKAQFTPNAVGVLLTTSTGSSNPGFLQAVELA